MYSFATYLLLFVVYSVLGWVLETTLGAIRKHKLVDRGFLIGPYCPIYGFGAVVMTMSLTRYLDDPLTVFLLAVVIAGLLEYFTSLVMEKIFRARWWDYSDKPFNIEGRVCLSYLVGFGLVALLALYVLNPPIVAWINGLGELKPLLAGILGVLILVDFVISTVVLSSIRKEQKTNSAKKDNTEELTAEVRRILRARSWRHRRLVFAFPDVKLIVSKEKRRLFKSAKKLEKAKTREKPEQTTEDARI